MSNRGAHRSRLGIALREYLVIWTIGNVIGARLWWSVYIRRKIRVCGYRHLRDAVHKGHLIIVSNHPSLIETALIPGLGWPKMLIYRRYFFWSMPDQRLFPKGLRWVHAITRGIEVDRSKLGSMYNARALNHAKLILQDRNTIVIHGEGGRTFKWHERKWYDREPLLLRHGQREMGELNPAVLKLAIKAKAWILPLWIDMPPELQKPRSFRQTIPVLFRGRFGGTRLSFEHPAYQPQTIDAIEETRLLERLLLNSDRTSGKIAQGELAAGP